jgi:hypothetical protein
MKAVIFGIPQENYNFKKLQNVMCGFEALGYDVQFVTPEKLLSWNSNADIAFIESDVPNGVNLNLFKKVVIWQNWSLSKAYDLAKKFPDVEFCLGQKSIVHSRAFRERYTRSFGTNIYQEYKETNEIIDISEFSNIDSPMHKVSNNLVCLFLPCTTASDARFAVEKDIDVVYFGTIANRPGVLRVLQELSKLPQQLRISAHFVEKGGPIHPEICVQQYRRARVCIHEHIAPAWGEYAVRFGESSSQGCRLISYTPLFGISDFFDDALVPEHDYANDVPAMIDRILQWLPDNNINTQKRNIMRKNSPSGVDFVNRMMSSFREIAKE